MCLYICIVGVLVFFTVCWQIPKLCCSGACLSIFSKLGFVTVILFISGFSLFAKTTTLTSATGTISGGGTWSAGIPATGDIVLVNAGSTLTIDASFNLASLTLNAGGTASQVTVSGTNTLTVSGAVTINGPTAAVTNTLNVAAGTLNAGSIVITAGTAAGRNATLSLSTGIVNCTGNTSLTGTGTSTFAFTGAGTATINGNYTGGVFSGFSGGTLNISGSFTPTTFTANSSTVNYNGTGAQAITSLAYYNLNCSNSGSKTTAAAFTVSHNATISGGTLTLGANLTVTGTLSVNAGTIDCQTYTVSGSITTVAAGATLISANVNGISASGATGSIQTTTRNFNTAANYTFDAGAAQITGNGLPASVNNLTINNISGVTLSQTVTVNGSLSLTTGSIDIGSNDLTIGTSGTITGVFGSSSMIITSSTGSLKKLGIVAADFVMLYPVGSGGNYTPMNISALTATINPSASIAVHAAPVQRMPSSSALKKYWSVTTANLTSINASVGFTYDASEVIGTEANYVIRRYDGSVFQVPEGAAINTTSKVISASGISVLTGDWTAIDPDGVNSIINGAVTVFQGRQQTYNISPGLTGYSWVVSGGTIISGQGTSSIVVSWNTTTDSGSVSVGYTQNGLNVAMPTLTVMRNTFPFSCFQYKRQIDIKGTMVSIGPLANFPLLVNVTDVTLKSVSNGGHITHNAGYDIYFASDAAGTLPLEYQLDYYDPVAGQLAVWVKIPSLTTTNSKIYMFYGNYSITFDASTPDVWGSDYVGVYHMGQNLKDYSMGCNDGVNVGTSIVTGKIGQGRLFTRNEKDFIQLSNETPFNFTSQMTVSFWISLNSYPTATGAGNDWMDYIAKGDNKNWRFVGNRLTTSPNCKNMWYTFGNAGNETTSACNSIPATSTWIQVVGTYNGALPLRNLFVNGVKVSQTTNLLASIQSYIVDNSPVIVGMNSQAQDTRAFDGIMDELQVSNQFKSDDWIMTGYRNQSDLTNVSLSVVGEQALTIISAATGGTASASPSSVFAREYSNLSLAGYTGTNIQWQTSSDNISFTDIAGKTSTPQQTDPLLANTYFRAMITNGGCPAASTSTFIAVTPPYITCSNGKRKKITINDSKYTGTDDLLNFPFLLQISNDSDIKQVPTGKVQSAKGWDIRFTDSDGVTMLPQQVESYDGASGSILVWVQIPRIYATQNTDFYMYYGDTNYASSDPTIAAVFDSKYTGVYHLGSGAGKSLFELTDATGNGNDGSNGPSPTTNVAGGKIGTASNFNGSNKYITLSNEPHFDIPNNGKLTLSAWVNITTYSGSAYAKYLDKGTGSWTLRRNNATTGVEMRQDYQSGEYLSAINTSGIGTGAWHYLVATYDHEVNNMTVYIDGSAAASSKNVPANQVLQNNTNQVRIGADAGATPGNYFNGSMDEVRIQNVARPADWIKFEYDNMNTPLGFATISAETSCSLGAPTPGTASANKTTLCIGQSAILTLTGYSGGIYWQKSTDNTNWSYITGANSATLNTGAITRNTYYRASVSNCCEAFSNSILITYVGSLPPASSFVVTDVACNAQNTGIVDLTVSQGSGSYTYLWSNTAITQDISLLSSGTYAVTITDVGTSCSVTGQSIVNQPAVLAVSITKTDETCSGLANGSATATSSGGTSPYTYSWSNGGNTAFVTGLTSGLYNLTVTDSKSCTVSSSASINSINSSPPTTVIHHD